MQLLLHSVLHKIYISCGTYFKIYGVSSLCKTFHLGCLIHTSCLLFDQVAHNEIEPKLHHHKSVPYVGVVQYTGSSSSRLWDSWSRKEFGDSERLAILMPPWLRDASSPDKAPVSSLWQQQRQMQIFNVNVRQSRTLSPDLSLWTVLNCTHKRYITWVCMAQRVEEGCKGPGGRSSWWVSLRVWLNCCLGFWLAADNKSRCVYIH